MTTTVNIVAGSWTNLGPGPAEIECMTSGSVEIIAAASSPVGDERGHLLFYGGGSSMTRMFFDSALTLWARAVASYVTVVVTSSAGAGVARVSSLARAAIAGTVAAGARSVTIKNSGAINVTVAGATLKPGEEAAFRTSGADTLAAIEYDALAGDILIVKVV